jgi:hypothetical protein
METATELHAFEYQHDGATWIIEIRATSQTDAWQRICRMQDGTYLGVVHARIPASMGWVARMICGVRNALNV